jgi:hypothetical protein
VACGGARLRINACSRGTAVFWRHLIMLGDADLGAGISLLSSIDAESQLFSSSGRECMDTRAIERNQEPAGGRDYE